MFFFKHGLINLTILIVVIWVMPVTSDQRIENLRGMELFIDIP